MGKEYRIVTDEFNGYEVQCRRWWFPIWLQVGINSHRTIEEARAFAEGAARSEVEYLGRFVPHNK